MASDPHLMSETVPVRITKKRHKELRRIAKANGHTISWLMNYALDLYFQSLEDGKPKFPEQSVSLSDLVKAHS